MIQEYAAIDLVPHVTILLTKSNPLCRLISNTEERVIQSIRLPTSLLNPNDLKNERCYQANIKVAAKLYQMGGFVMMCKYLYL